jgi:hypothetical protein
MSNNFPVFKFTPPCGYTWLLERKMVAFKPFGALQPWYYIKRDEIINLRERWPNGPSKIELIAFARRQDNDDIACFGLEADGVVSVVVVHGWTDSGYDIAARYATFWDWLKSVVDDIRECCEEGAAVITCPCQRIATNTQTLKLTDLLATQP